VADVDQRLDRLGGLVDPVRRALYRFVAAAGELVSRDEAAEAVDVSRSLAAYHLDRLADDGAPAAAARAPGDRRSCTGGPPARSP
jgi:DNA-binding transcriptional ArsR family regulator